MVKSEDRGQIVTIGKLLIDHFQDINVNGKYSELLGSECNPPLSQHGSVDDFPITAHQEVFYCLGSVP